MLASGVGAMARRREATSGASPGVAGLLTSGVDPADSQRGSVRRAQTQPIPAFQGDLEHIGCRGTHADADWFAGTAKDESQRRMSQIPVP